VQVLGAGGGLGGPARPGGNFGGKTPNLGAAPKRQKSIFWECGILLNTFEIWGLGFGMST